jgi:uncharacterized BrkB/YihY/UPF0761 family membrane protein
MTKHQLLLRRSISWTSAILLGIAFNAVPVAITVILVSVISEITKLRRRGRMIHESSKPPIRDIVIFAVAVTVSIFITVFSWWFVTRHNPMTWPWLLVGLLIASISVAIEIKSPWRWEPNVATQAK